MSEREQECVDVREKEGREREKEDKRQNETERERGRQEVSDLGWMREEGLAGFWRRSVVVQKSSRARRQRVRRGP